jgi:hypothetical protein
MNYRAAMRIKDKYEIGNTISRIEVSFFHRIHPRLFKKFYLFLIDYMTLDDIRDIFDNLKNKDLIDFVLSNLKCKSLFNGSIHKENFI